MELKENQLFLPMKKEAVDSLLRFIEMDMVQEIFELIKFSKRNLIDNSILSTKFPLIHEAEIAFEYHIVRMYWETEQLLYLTPPIIHTSIRKHLLNDIGYLESELKKKTLLETIKKNLNQHQISDKNKNGAFSKGLTKTVKNSSLNLKQLDSTSFDEYLTFLNSLLEKFKHELSFFLSKDNETQVTFSKQMPSTNEMGKGSIFIDCKIEDFLINQKTFIEICRRYSNPIEDPISLEQVKLISYNNITDTYIWNGLGKGMSLPMLGVFIRELFENNIIRLIPKEKAAKAIMEFFSLPKIDDSSINFLARKFERKAENITAIENKHIKFFKSTMM